MNKQKVCLSASLEEQPLIVNAGNNKNTKQNMKNISHFFSENAIVKIIKTDNKTVSKFLQEDIVDDNNIVEYNHIFSL